MTAWSPTRSARGLRALAPTLAVLGLATAAHAGAPAGVVADDPEPYEDAWSALVDGPPGCWEVVGRATWRYDGGRFGGVTGDAVFVGRLDDGAWQDFLIRSLGEDQRRGRSQERRAYPHDETRFVPLVGRRKPSMLARQDEGDQVIAAMVEGWGSSTMSLYSQWDDEQSAVVLHRGLPIGGGDSEEADMQVVFPEGAPVPASMRIVFPDRFRLPNRRIVAIHNADARIRARQAGGMTFPDAETFSFEARVLGFQFSGAQTIDYQTFRPCGEDASDRPKAVVE